MRTVVLSRSAARRFLIDAFGLSQFQGHADPLAVIDRLEFVQEDSINICGRIHDLILWPRVRDYAPERLEQTLYGPKPGAFEYHFSNLCALPLADYAHFRGAMRRRAAEPERWRGLLPHEEPVALDILARIQSDGPLRTRDACADHGHTTSGWGPKTTVAAFVAAKLWTHGRLAICRRENFEKVFDLPERVHPEALTLPEPDAEETQTYLARKRCRVRRLFRPSPNERRALGTEAFVEVRVDGVAKPWFALAEDEARLIAARSAASPTETHLLAPLDPLVYDRTRTGDLFDFDYRWEVYTPAAKRVRGYYALPILQGEEIVGWVDPKMDRKRRTLEICGIDVARNADRSAVDARIEQFARFLGADSVAPAR